jgi:hypothetical protein
MIDGVSFSDEGSQSKTGDEDSQIGIEIVQKSAFGLYSSYL